MATQSFELIHLTDLEPKIDGKNPVIGAFLLFFLFFITFLFVYFLFVCTHNRRGGGGNTANADAHPQGSPAQSMSSLGLDPAIISSLPMFSYGSSRVNCKKSSLESECAICLSMFQEGEKVKVLPKCNHGFHSECVDKWLRERSSCPLCSASIHNGDRNLEMP